MRSWRLAPITLCSGNPARDCSVSLMTMRASLAVSWLLAASAFAVIAAEFARQHNDLGKPLTVTEGAKVTVNIDRALFLNQP
jgi:hypothetical protein